LTTLKIAVFAPTPSASVMTTTSVSPRAYSSMRPAYRTSCSNVLICLRSCASVSCGFRLRAERRDAPPIFRLKPEATDQGGARSLGP
jgi:hypothetical protein